MRGLTIQSVHFSFGRNIETELGRDDHLVPKRRERFADKLFVRISAIHFSGIEECHALIDGGADERNALAFLYARPIPMAQPHASNTDANDLQTALPYLPFSTSHFLLF